MMVNVNLNTTCLGTVVQHFKNVERLYLIVSYLNYHKSRDVVWWFKGKEDAPCLTWYSVISMKICSWFHCNLLCPSVNTSHYSGVTEGRWRLKSSTTGLLVDQRDQLTIKKASLFHIILALVRGIHQSAVVSPCKWPVMMTVFHATMSSCEKNNTTPLLVKRPRQNGRNFPDDIFKRIFLNENVWILFNISLRFVPKVRVNNIPALVQIMAWRRPGDKPSSEPMVIQLLRHICVTRPQ